MNALKASDLCQSAAKTCATFGGFSMNSTKRWS